MLLLKPRHGACINFSQSNETLGARTYILVPSRCSPGRQNTFGFVRLGRPGSWRQTLNRTPHEPVPRYDGWPGLPSMAPNSMPLWRPRAELCRPMMLALPESTPTSWSRPPTPASLPHHTRCYLGICLTCWAGLPTCNITAYLPDGSTKASNHSPGVNHMRA